MKLMIQIQKKQFFFPASFQHRPLTGRGEGAAGGLCWQLRPALGAGPFDAAAAAEERAGQAATAQRRAREEMEEDGEREFLMGKLGEN